MEAPDVEKAGLRPRAAGCLDAHLRRFFEAEHSTSQMVSSVARQIEHAGRFASSTIVVLSSSDVAWQRAILQQLLLKDGFNVLCGTLANDVAELLRQSESQKAVVLWLLNSAAFEGLFGGEHEDFSYLYVAFF